MFRGDRDRGAANWPLPAYFHFWRDFASVSSASAPASKSGRLRYGLEASDSREIIAIETARGDRGQGFANRSALGVWKNPPEIACTKVNEIAGFMLLI